MPQRRITEQTVAITTSAATTGGFNYVEYVSGNVIVPTGSSLTTLTWYTSDNAGTVRVLAKDGAGNSITSTVAQTQSVAIPAALSGAAIVYIVGNAAGSVVVTLKN